MGKAVAKELLSRFRDDLTRHPSFHFRCIRPPAITQDDIESWLDLERRALEPNAYLSPLFLIPAFRYLATEGLPDIIFLEEQASGRRKLLAVAVLEMRKPSREMPLTHLRSYHTPHSFVGGMLVARENSGAVLEALFFGLCRLRGHGIAVPLTRIDGATDDLLKGIAADSGLARIEKDTYLRAAMKPGSLGGDYVAARLGERNRRLNSKRKKLANLGNVEVVLLRGKEIDDAAVERHIALEHMGWKGQNGTSLRSHSEDEAFFRDVARGFATQGRAVFTELRVGERVIASTSNFLSGRKGFAFKIGFDPEFAKFSPGIITEMELINRAPEWLRDIDEFDSGAAAGSYLEDLWPERHKIGTAIYSTTKPGNIAAWATRKLSSLKRVIKRA